MWIHQPEREGAEVFEEATSWTRKKTGKRPDSLEPEQVGDNENVSDENVLPWTGF